MTRKLSLNVKGTWEILHKLTSLKHEKRNVQDPFLFFDRNNLPLILFLKKGSIGTITPEGMSNPPSFSVDLSPFSMGYLKFLTRMKSYLGESINVALKSINERPIQNFLNKSKYLPAINFSEVFKEELDPHKSLKYILKSFYLKKQDVIRELNNYFFPETL